MVDRRVACLEDLPSDVCHTDDFLKYITRFGVCEKTTFTFRIGTSEDIKKYIQKKDKAKLKEIGNIIS